MGFGYGQPLMFPESTDDFCMIRVTVEKASLSRILWP